MARIIYSPIVTEIKGSIGGMTFQKNASGSIARLKPKKNKTNTIKQRNQQPRLKEVQNEWNKLSFENKIEWNSFASNYKKIGLNGQEKNLTGYQWFLTINQNRALFEDSFLLSPPTYEIYNPTDNPTFFYNAEQQNLSLEFPNNVANLKAVINCSFVLKSISKVKFEVCRAVYIGTQNVNSYLIIEYQNLFNYWSDYFNSTFPPKMGGKNFYLIAYVRFISPTSGISSIAYSTIGHFIWDGSKYIIEEF